MRCAACEAPATTGVLCETCRTPLAPARTLLREHLASRHVRDGAPAWLIDGFGAAHPLATSRTVIGRRPDAEMMILHGSVSRDHAELRHADDGWTLRDLGSRNKSRVDGAPLAGRVRLDARARVRFGDVELLFVGAPIALPDRAAVSVATAHVSGAGTSTFEVRGPDIELCLLVPASDDEAGVLLHRRAGTTAWTELAVPALELHLMRLLCTRGAEHTDSPTRSAAAVTTRQLARELPFHTRSPDDENVRQIVRRLRTTLATVGADAAVASLPRRGYFLDWPVARR